MSQQKRRLSILKKKVIEEPSPTTTLTLKNKRISFSGKKTVKEFCAGEDAETIWGKSYEESANSSSSKSLENGTNMFYRDDKIEYGFKNSIIPFDQKYWDLKQTKSVSHYIESNDKENTNCNYIIMDEVSENSHNLRRPETISKIPRLSLNLTKQSFKENKTVDDDNNDDMDISIIEEVKPKVTVDQDVEDISVIPQNSLSDKDNSLSCTLYRSERAIFGARRSSDDGSSITLDATELALVKTLRKKFKSPKKIKKVCEENTENSINLDIDMSVGKMNTTEGFLEIEMMIEKSQIHNNIAEYIKENTSNTNIECSHLIHNENQQPTKCRRTVIFNESININSTQSYNRKIFSNAHAMEIDQNCANHEGFLSNVGLPNLKYDDMDETLTANNISKITKSHMDIGQLDLEINESVQSCVSLKDLDDTQTMLHELSKPLIIAETNFESPIIIENTTRKENQTEPFDIFMDHESQEQSILSKSAIKNVNLHSEIMLESCIKSSKEPANSHQRVDQRKTITEPTDFSFEIPQSAPQKSNQNGVAKNNQHASKNEKTEPKRTICDPIDFSFEIPVPSSYKFKENIVVKSDIKTNNLSLNITSTNFVDENIRQTNKNQRDEQRKTISGSMDFSFEIPRSPPLNSKQNFVETNKQQPTEKEKAETKRSIYEPTDFSFEIPESPLQKLKQNIVDTNKHQITQNEKNEPRSTIGVPVDLSFEYPETASFKLYNLTQQNQKQKSSSNRRTFCSPVDIFIEKNTSSISKIEDSTVSKNTSKNSKEESNNRKTIFPKADITIEKKIESIRIDTDFYNQQTESRGSISEAIDFAFEFPTATTKSYNLTHESQKQNKPSNLKTLCTSMDILVEENNSRIAKIEDTSVPASFQNSEEDSSNSKTIFPKADISIDKKIEPMRKDTHSNDQQIQPRRTICEPLDFSFEYPKTATTKSNNLKQDQKQKSPNRRTLCTPVDILIEENDLSKKHISNTDQVKSNSLRKRKSIHECIDMEIEQNRKEDKNLITSNYNRSTNRENEENTLSNKIKQNLKNIHKNTPPEGPILKRVNLMESNDNKKIVESFLHENKIIKNNHNEKYINNARKTITFEGEDDPIHVDRNNDFELTGIKALDDSTNTTNNICLFNAKMSLCKTGLPNKEDIKTNNCINEGIDMDISVFEEVETSLPNKAITSKVIEKNLDIIKNREVDNDFHQNIDREIFEISKRVHNFTILAENKTSNKESISDSNTFYNKQNKNQRTTINFQDLLAENNMDMSLINEVSNEIPNESNQVILNKTEGDVIKIQNIDGNTKISVFSPETVENNLSYLSNLPTPTYNDNVKQIPTIDVSSACFANETSPIAKKYKSPRKNSYMLHPTDGQKTSKSPKTEIILRNSPRKTYSPMKIANSNFCRTLNFDENPNSNSKQNADTKFTPINNSKEQTSCGESPVVFFNISDNLEEIEKTKLSLVEISENTTQQSFSIPKEIENQIKLDNSFNTDKRVSPKIPAQNRRTMKNQICSRCKNCRTSMDATEIYNFKLDSKSIEAYDFSALDKLKGLPSLRDIWISIELRQAEKYSLNFEKSLNYNASVNSSYFDQEILQIENCFPLNNKFESQLKNSFPIINTNWKLKIFSLYSKNFILLTHEGCLTLELLIECSPLHFKNYEMKIYKIYTRKSCIYNEESWSPSDKLIHMEIFKKIPSNSSLYNKYSKLEVLNHCLQFFNEIILETITNVKQLMRIIIINKADLQHYEDKVAIVKNYKYYLNKILKKKLILIKIYQLDETSIGNVIHPAITEFNKNVIQNFPNGIEFIELMLTDPIKYLA